MHMHTYLIAVKISMAHCDWWGPWQCWGPSLLYLSAGGRPRYIHH